MSALDAMLTELEASLRGSQSADPGHSQACGCDACRRAWMAGGERQRLAHLLINRGDLEHLLAIARAARMLDGEPIVGSPGWNALQDRMGRVLDGAEAHASRVRGST